MTGEPMAPMRDITKAGHHEGGPVGEGGSRIHQPGFDIGAVRPELALDRRHGSGFIGTRAQNDGAAPGRGSRSAAADVRMKKDLKNLNDNVTQLGAVPRDCTRITRAAVGKRL